MKVSVLLSCFASAAAFAPSAPQWGLAKASPIVMADAARRGGDESFRNQVINKPSSKRKTTLAFGKKKVDDVILDPDFTLTWQFAMLGCVILLYHPCKLVVIP